MANLTETGELSYSIEAKKCLATTCREVGEKLIKAGKIDLGARYLKEAIDHAADVFKLSRLLRLEKDDRHRHTFVSGPVYRGIDFYTGHRDLESSTDEARGGGEPDDPRNRAGQFGFGEYQDGPSNQEHSS